MGHRKRNVCSFFDVCTLSGTTPVLCLEQLQSENKHLYPVRNRPGWVTESKTCVVSVMPVSVWNNSRLILQIVELVVVHYGGIVMPLTCRHAIDILPDPTTWGCVGSRDQAAWTAVCIFIPCCSPLLFLLCACSNFPFEKFELVDRSPVGTLSGTTPVGGHSTCTLSEIHPDGSQKAKHV